ncbi:MAG: hypothetical protein WAJ85_15000 [Candidatus Baltobacteraceae bacterium]|jgi:hypothetical protein
MRQGPLRAGAALLLAVCAFSAAPAAPDVAPGTLDADGIFARAKAEWRARAEAPFVRYNLLERYTWRGRTHDNWWQAAYRSSDHALVLHRTIVAEQEEERLKGSPIKINLRFHHADASGDQLDTNPNADAFPVLDPLIEPDASFGMRRHEPQAALVGAATPAPGLETALPAAPSSQPEVPEPGETPLRELIRVEAVARDYRIALAGIEHLRYGDAYHLTLQPLREPNAHRLRDLWVATDTYATVQLTLAGLFEGKPYAEARWTVTYTPLDGRWYVQQIKTADTLRFGLDRFVSDLEYDFVQYDFPASIPDITFERLL